MTTRVLVLDDHELLAQSVSFLAAGSGFRRRPLPLADYDTLVDQVRADPPDVILLDLQLGGEVLSPEARRLLLTELRVHRAEQKASRMPFERLSPHERQVLRALCDGKSVTAIATEWVTSIATVRAQVRAVLAKLGAGSQLEAVAEANRCGWYAEPHPTELHLHQA